MILSGRRSIPLTLTLLMLTLVLLSACGGNANPATSKATPTPKPSPTPTAGPGQQELNQMAAKLNNARTLHGIFHLSMNGQEANGTLETELWKQAPDKNRAEIKQSSVPQVEAGSLTVTDGKQLWQYDPGKKTVYHGNVTATTDIATNGDNSGIGSPNGGQGQSLLNLIQVIFTQSDGTLRSSTSQVNGRQVYDIHVVPQEGGVGGFDYSGEVYIDKAAQLPLKVDMNINSVGKVMLDIQQLDINPTLSANIFTYTPPAGVKERPLSEATGPGNGMLNLAQAEKQAGFHLLSIPADKSEYTLNGVSALGTPGTQTFSLNYMKGNVTIIIAEGKTLANLPATGQQVNIRNTTGTLTNSNGTSTLAWTEKGIGIRISGPLSSDEITALANSLS